ncbi:Thioredoxin reductase (EC [Olavius algarvensis associated proteobacterium Delta 3]|nr:Thioredoxin reductase (EC [Olavius algarvensis associated proteobacterium Delta 3]CAB5148699.1 Thioredoxin reductase (EC [Olavius algarvensis associated proteobacterium Delta 3]
MLEPNQPGQVPVGQPQPPPDYANQIGEIFKKLPNEIHLFLFSNPGMDDVFSQSIRQAVRAFRDLTSKIIFREYPVDHEMAREWNVDAGPALLFEPDHYNIRWYGGPLGEEGRTFLELLIYIGLGKSNLSEQSLHVLRKIQEPRQVKVFVSPTCPYCPQQAVNAVKAAIERPEVVSLELIDIQCRPDLADQYSAHSVPQAYANDALIAMGAQTEELFMASLDKLEPQTVFIPEIESELVEVDLVIVGGGPAGLTAGIYAERSGLNAAIIEKGALGGQVALTPTVENYPGLTQVGGKTLVDIMVTHALEYTTIFPGEEVIDITIGSPFEVKTSRRRFLAKTILLATGASHRHLDVPGESRLSGRGVSYCATCDGMLFQGKKVIVVGGGNSAVTEALYLKNIGIDVTLVHRRDSLRAQEFLAKNLEENQIPVLWNTEVQEIRGEERVAEVLLKNNQTDDTSTLPIDGVFVAIGYEPSVELAKKLGVALNEDGFIQKDENHRTNIPGIYSAGDVEGGYKQIVTAAGQGSEAAMSIFEDMINPYWTKEKETVS